MLWQCVATFAHTNRLIFKSFYLSASIKISWGQSDGKNIMIKIAKGAA